MRVSLNSAALLGLAITGVDAAALWPLVSRDIPNIGHHTMRGNISSIASWTYAALAYGAITASNSTSELTYLCAHFDEISSRYSAAFPEPSGDMAKFARDAVCSASKATNPSPDPLAQNNLWYMKSYVAASFIIQGYSGNLRNSSYYAQMCWFLESSLLTGLWAPCADTDESGVDAESSFCASAGYYGKDDYSRYTNATQPADVVERANVLVSTVMASVLGVVLGSEAQQQYLCGNWARYVSGIKRLGLVDTIIQESVCGAKVVEVAVAKKSMLGAMTDLFSYQLLKGGNDAAYPEYLCQVLKKNGLVTVGLDGEKIVTDACKAANVTQS